MNLTDLMTRHLALFESTTTKRGDIPRANTIAAHRLQLERFARTLEHRDGDRPSVNDGKQWINQLAAAARVSRSVSNVNQALTALTGFYRFLADEGLFDRGDLASWEQFHKQQYKPWRRGAPNLKYLHDDKLARLFDAISTKRNDMQGARDSAFFGLILFGPSRLNEVRMLDGRDVQYVSATPDVPAHFICTVRPECAKDHEQHTLFLFAGQAQVGTVNIFERMLEYQQWRVRALTPEEPFFVNLKRDHLGQRPSRTNMHKVLSTVCSESGVSCSSHWLRHTFGEHVAGVLDPRELRQMYGHTDTRTTEGYTDHDDLNRARSAALRASAAISTQS